MSRHALGLVLLASLWFVLPGCQNTDRAGNSSTGVKLPEEAEAHSAELQRNQFVDIPAPKDMTLVTGHNESYSFQRGGVRVARLQYWGTSSGVEDVVSFYRETMEHRPFGCDLASDRTEGEVQLLTFRKEAERCDIEVKRENRGTTALIYLNNVK